MYIDARIYSLVTNQIYDIILPMKYSYNVYYF